MSVYSGQIASTLALIQAKGRSIVYIRNLDVQPTSPVSDTPAAQDAVEVTVAAVTLPYSNSTTRQEGKFERGTMVQSRTEQVLIAGTSLPFEPREVDWLKYDGELWQIESFNKIAPDGTPILYTFIVSR